MARIPNDPTIHVGLRLLDGTDYDTTVERVAHGGFGAIAFGPNRLDQDRMVAYKTLRRELLADPSTRASFVRECLLWSGLWTHPNVAQVYAVMEMSDATGLRPFIALAYAEQGSLRDLLQAAQSNQSGGRLPLDIGLHLAQQIAAGLAYLHTPDPDYLRPEPTVHRDLKPENVLLTKGRAVITDFGLAKAVEASPAALAILLTESGEPGDAETTPLVGEAATRTTGLHTVAGATMGTPTYMPAEQWLGARDAGPAADLYAFGIMLSELLAGRHALLDLGSAHSRAAWRQAHLDPHPRPLRDIEPQIPARVEALYQRCLARDPAARPSATEALAELQAGAQEAGMAVYSPSELVEHTRYNELAYWHRGSIAYARFERFEEALERSDRALDVAQRLTTEAPERTGLIPIVLVVRGNILKGLGQLASQQAEQSRTSGDMVAAREVERKAATWDEQAKNAYQGALAAYPPETTAEGSRGRSFVWNQLGVFHSERKHHAAADSAYARALTLRPDMADTYYNRAANLRMWGVAEAQVGEHAAAIAHLREARVHAITSLGLRYPPAAGLIQRIEATLATVEQAAQS